MPIRRPFCSSCAEELELHRDDEGAPYWRHYETKLKECSS